MCLRCLPSTFATTRHGFATIPSTAVSKSASSSRANSKRDSYNTWSLWVAEKYSPSATRFTGSLCVNRRTRRGVRGRTDLPCTDCQREPGRLPEASKRELPRAALYSEQDKSDASQATRRVATAATGFDTGRGFHARPGRLAQNVCLRCMFADLKTSCRRIGKDCI